MQSTRILAADAAFDPSKRTVIPLAEAVRAPRFSTSRHWAVSSLARELVDQIHAEIRVPQTPPPEPAIDPAESIIMSGNVIENRMTTGAHVVRQRRTVGFETLPELAFLEPALMPDDSIRNAAGEALAALNQRRVTPARRAVPAPSAGRGGLWIAFAIAAGVVAMLLKVIFTGVLL